MSLLRGCSFWARSAGRCFCKFPKFDKWAFASSGEFVERLRVFLGRLASVDKAGRMVVEIRNKDWLDARLMGLLRERNVALALTDTSFLPRPWEMEEKMDLLTADLNLLKNRDAENALASEFAPNWNVSGTRHFR